jgi:thiamine kinase-like enzyme
MVEEELSGGNMSQVTRLGDTVRRGTGSWTKHVHWLLEHLKSRGIAEVPAPLGYDDQGREVLRYIPGLVGHYPLSEVLRSDEILISAARLLRRLHDATQDIAQIQKTDWQAPTREPIEVICHGDFAPYNCVFDEGKLVGVIDFDHAHPGPRLWDIAYAIYRFAPMTAPSNPDGFGALADQARRMRLFCEAYGMQDRSQVVTAIIQRVKFMADMLLVGAAQGDARMQANLASGHLSIYQTDAVYLEENHMRLELVLG